MEHFARGLLMPEGPVPMADGSVLFVEVGGDTLSRLSPDGSVNCVAELGGGPNGLAIGPDGAAYVCNNGGGFDMSLVDGALRFDLAPERYVGGSIQRVRLADGRVDAVFARCDGAPLIAPNDLVFDAAGGFWFTDHGAGSVESRTPGAILYARPEGRSIRRVRDGLFSPNGIGLSPDGQWLYWTDTHKAQLWRAAIAGPGILADYGNAPGELMIEAPEGSMFDSMAIEADGRICIGTIGNGGITVVDPAGGTEHVPIDDHIVTNIAFGGADRRDAWITAAGTGVLLRSRWPRPGAPLAFVA